MDFLLLGRCILSCRVTASINCAWDKISSRRKQEFISLTTKCKRCKIFRYNLQRALGWQTKTRKRRAKKSCQRTYSSFKTESGNIFPSKSHGQPKEHCCVWKLPNFAHLSFRWEGRIKLRMNMEYRWNDNYREKLKYSEINLPQCHSVDHKSNMDWSGIETGPPRWQGCDNCQEFV
jgi:hypothetical protein